MPKTRELSTAQRAQIKILSEQKYSIRRISDVMKISKSTVGYTLKRIAEKKSLSPRERSGRFYVFYILGAQGRFFGWSPGRKVKID